MRLLPLFVRAQIEQRPIQSGDGASWPIANDVHPARVISGPEQGADDRGRVGRVITLLVQRTTREGTPYSRIQRVLENFVMEPIEGNLGELLFGTEKAPLTLNEALGKHAERFGDFLASKAEDATVAVAAPEA